MSNNATEWAAARGDYIPEPTMSRAAERKRTFDMMKSGAVMYGVAGVAPVAATGATAGIPGSFTPAGCVKPVGVAQMAGIVANPATPWTTGQFVQTQTAGVAGRATWSGSSWVGGIAP